MKQLILMLAMGMTVSYASAQKMKSSEIPAAVTSRFTSLYPSIKEVDWEKDEANYEAVFELNKMEATVLIDVNGNLIETEMDIEVAALPKNCSDYVAANFSAYKIKGAVKITDAKGVVMYEAELKKGLGDEMDLLFDANGNFVKKAVEENKVEDEDDEKSIKKN